MMNVLRLVIVKKLTYFVLIYLMWTFTREALTNFMPLVSFYTPLEPSSGKPEVFWCFREGQKETNGINELKVISKDYWPENLTRSKSYSKCCRVFNVCLTILWALGIIGLTHFQPVFHFYTPWKHLKTSSFSYVFRGYRRGTLVENGLKLIFVSFFGNNWLKSTSPFLV